MQFKKYWPLYMMMVGGAIAFLAGSFASSRSPQWKPVKDAEILDRVATQNNSSSTEIASLKVESFDIYDFNDPNLCGADGCLYAVYDDDRLLLQILVPEVVGAPPQFAYRAPNCLGITVADRSETWCEEDGQLLKLNWEMTNERTTDDR